MARSISSASTPVVTGRLENQASKISLVTAGDVLLRLGPLPSLVYHSTDPISKQLMEPLLKLGIIQTRTTEGFEKREAQVALRLSQPKFTITKRGVRGRTRDG